MSYNPLQIDVSAGTTSLNNGTAVFSNANGVSFGLNGSTMTASIGTMVGTGTSATNASITLNSNGLAISVGVGGGGGIALANSQTTYTSGTAVLSVVGGGAMTIASTTGQSFNFSVPAQSYLSATGGISISVSSNTVSIGMANPVVSAQGGSSSFGTLVFTNSNGFSFSNTGGSIWGSYTVPTITNSSLTMAAGGSTLSSVSQVVFSNANGVSFGASTSNNGSITITASVNAGGAFSADGGSSTFGTLTFVDTNGVSFSNSNGSIYASVATNYLTTAALSSQTLGFSLSGNIATTNSSRISNGAYALAGGNGVTLQQSNNTVSISVATNYQSQGAYLTTAALSQNTSNYAGINSAITGGSMTVNTSGISINLPAYLTTAMLSNANTSFVGLNSALTGNGVLATINSSGISLNIPAFLTTADLSANSSKYIQNWKLTGNTAGTTSSAQGTDFWLAGGNGVTISGSSNTLSFSVATNYQSQGAYLTTAMVSNANTSFVGLNTAQSNVTWTVNSSGISLNAAGYAGTGTTFNGANISGSITNNSAGLNLSLSVAAPGGGGAINVSAGTTSNNLQTVVFSNSNNISFGLSGSTVTGSVPGTSSLSATGGFSISVNGATISMGVPNPAFSASGGSSSFGTLTFVNTNNITFSNSNGSVQASYQQPIKSYFEYIPLVQGTTTFTLGGSSNFVQPFVLPYDISCSYVRLQNSFGFGSTSFGTTANISLTLQHSHSIWVNLYSLGTGGSSRSLQQFAQGSASYLLQVQAQVGAASNNQTISHNITYPSEGASNNNFATSYNLNSGTINISTTHLTAFSGVRFLDIPFASSLSAGAYWMGVAESTASATTGGTMASVTMNNSFIGASQISYNINILGGNTSAGSNGMQVGLGYWTTNTNGTSSSSMGLASISTIANQPRLPFQLIRQA